MRQETVLGDKWLRLAYCSPIRGLLQWPLFGCAAFSRLMGWYLNSHASAKKINPTIQELKIPMDEAVVPPGGFRCFNDFFARPLKPGARPLPEDESRLISPADCRLTVFPNIPAGVAIPVKGVPFSVQELLGNEGAQFVRQLAGGSLMVCRLCPADYHRYHFPDAGTTLKYWRLRGKYHSVNPLALSLGFKVFAENLRTVRMMQLAHAKAPCAMICVGAFGVASIHDQPGDRFERGDEAGFFTFGGSTVIMVFPPETVRFDDDLVEHSAAGIETLVKVNSAIGTWIC
ncbi:MAG: phosphatidylserine decarboxylase [Victivallales bacterium]|nr:phosphatidylserine decarboxylase [Victivallales bacterium]